MNEREMILTEKENWKRMHQGDMPEFLPKYDIGAGSLLLYFDGQEKSGRQRR
jgi:hypothetical protein